MTHRICTATTKSGQPCRAPAVTAAGLCVSHAPEMRARVKEGQAKGGRRKATRERLSRAMPRDMAWLAERLSDAFDAVSTGRMEPKVGTALASIAGALVKTHEVGVLTAKLEEIDRRLKQAESDGKAA